jgi:hypothetical protein
VTDIVEFIGAQLDEEERVARAATPGPWRYNPDRQWHTPEDVEEGLNGEEFVGAGPLYATVGVAATGPADHPQSMVDALFISVHDPVRVLAGVDAARRILAAHPVGPDGDCTTCRAYPGGAAVHAPCPTLRALALPYADQAGYHTEWRP